MPNLFKPEEHNSVLRTGHDTENKNDFHVALCNLQIPWTRGRRPVSGSNLAGIGYNYIFSTILLSHIL
jgi:hypothetical protein